MGLVRPFTDAHTLGLSSITSLLEECGIRTFTGAADVCRETERVTQTGNVPILEAWIRDRQITLLGFSYRLDPDDGVRLFTAWHRTLQEKDLLVSRGGPIRAVWFAGLPSACAMVRECFPGLAGCFQGDETPYEAMQLLGIDPSLMPSSLLAGNVYDEARMRFGRQLVTKGEYHRVRKVERQYNGFGTEKDNLAARVSAGRKADQPPLMRAHVGPYTGDPLEDFRLFRGWTKELAKTGLLDVLSIGTSQLTQSDFYGDRTGLPDGGGIVIPAPEAYRTIWDDARPMLVRTYAGTRDIPRLAAMHEDNLHIAWHALSFWWFCRLDGRGPYPLAENLQQHFDTMHFIASKGKILEPNVPHHFAFRGADDVTYAVAGYLAAKAAKKAGIGTLVLQIMLNTPKTTSGLQDLAKARVLRTLVRTLEDGNFSVLLQPRGGLDYFSPDLEKAKAQLAAVTALMADIEPSDRHSPAIIHVVSYSEAVRLADPPVIDESIRITREAFSEYRRMRRSGEIENPDGNPELAHRTRNLLTEAQTVINAIEELVPDPYSAAGFLEIFAQGFLPVPRLWECRDEFPEAVRWETRQVDGAIRVVGADGTPVPAVERMAIIREQIQRRQP